MARTVEEALELAKEIIAADLEVELQRQATRAVSSHKLLHPNPKRTGKLVGDIRARATNEGVEVSFPYYAVYLEYGTGLHGPEKRRITPKVKKAMKWGSDNAPIFAKSTEGMYPSPFIRPTFHQKFVDIVVKALNEAFDEVAL